MVSTLILAALLHQTSMPTDFAKAWSQVSGVITGEYYARATRKAEMDRLLAKYKPIASVAASQEAFESTVNAMIGEFRDSHFALFSLDDQGYYLMDALSTRHAKPMPEIGAWFKKTPDGYVTSMVLNGTAAANAGLRKGDLLTSIDGQPFSPVKSLSPKVGKKVELGVLRNGRRISVQAEVSRAPVADLFLKASEESARVIGLNGRHIGYFHLWTQLDDTFGAALSNAIYGKFADTDAMILDLRDGFGGTYNGFADPFFRPEITVTRVTPSSKDLDRFGYQRPLIVLINEGSRSAKEVLSFILKKSKRAKLIGSRTAGNVLAASPREISNWAYLEIPIIDLWVDGVRLENNGVTPDIAVPREYDENGKDLVLARALEELKDVPIHL